MNYKLIATDLDGTLLTGDMRVSPENNSAISEYKRAGGVFAVSSGRTFYAIPNDVRANPDIRYYSMSNGSVVYDKKLGKNIISHHIPSDAVNKLMDLAEEFNLLCAVQAGLYPYVDSKHIEDEDNTYNINDYYLELLEHYEPTRNYISICRGMQDAECFLFFFADEEEMNACLERLKDIKEVAVTSSVARELEIYSADAGKGKALTELAKHLNIPNSEVISVGDSENDITMTEAAGLGLATGNAMDSLKEVADDVICTNEEHIVPYILDKYIRPSYTKKDTLRKNKNKILAAAVSVAVIAILVVRLCLGLGNSAVKVGYVGTAGWASWTGTYASLNGKMTHTIHPDNDTVKFSFTTEEGNISVTVYNSKGEEIYSRENIGTETFELDVRGKVKIKIEAEKHKGSFVIGD